MSKFLVFFSLMFMAWWSKEAFSESRQSVQALRAAAYEQDFVTKTLHSCVESMSGRMALSEALRGCATNLARSVDQHLIDSALHELRSAGRL